MMPTTPQNSFPALTAFTTDAEMLQLLKRGDIAIGYALEHVPSWEMTEFFKDWQNDADMTPWLREWREKQDSAAATGEADRKALQEANNEPDYSDLRAFNRKLAAQRREREARKDESDPKQA